MSELSIDLELIRLAFEDREGEGRWFLDRETGEVVRLYEREADARYLQIPYQGSVAADRDVAEFIDSVSDNRLRALLHAARNDRRFSDVLQEHPDERARWFAFQKKRACRRIRRWLENEARAGSWHPLEPRR